MLSFSELKIGAMYIWDAEYSAALKSTSRDKIPRPEIDDLYVGEFVKPDETFVVVDMVQSRRKPLHSVKVLTATGVVGWLYLWSTIPILATPCTKSES